MLGTSIYISAKSSDFFSHLLILPLWHQEISMLNSNQYKQRGDANSVRITSCGFTQGGSMNLKNVLMVANDLNLYEHQSTLNRNMPLRGLLYLARMYESYIETHKLNRYQKKLIRLPFPRFVVFYNGEDDTAEEFTMRLSEAFEDKAEEPAVECVAKFVNINYGHNKELMDKCRRLHDYSYFVACVRKYLQQGMERQDAVVAATDECIAKDILADILIKNRSEVMDMFLTKFDKKMYEEALREEGRDEAHEKWALEKEALLVANKEMSKTIEEKAKANNELLQKQRIYIKLLKENGICFEDTCEIMEGVSEEEFEKEVISR